MHRQFPGLGVKVHQLFGIWVSLRVSNLWRQNQKRLGWCARVVVLCGTGLLNQGLYSKEANNIISL